VVALFVAMGSREWMALITFGFSAFVLTVIVVEFWKGTSARARIEGEGALLAFYHLVARNRRRWGGYTVHVGVVLIFTAFAGTAWNVNVKQTLVPGESTDVISPLGHTYTLTFEGMSSTLGRPDQPNNRNLAWQAIALFTVAKDGEPAGFLTSEKRMYLAPEQVVTEVGIRSTPLEDLYLILSDVEDLPGVVLSDADAVHRATFTFLVNPLVPWIWYGALVLTLGSLIAMWPEPERLREGGVRSEPDAREREPALPGARVAAVFRSIVALLARSSDRGPATATGSAKAGP